MAYTPLSENPLGVLSKYGAEIATASPNKLKEYLSATQQFLRDSQIELPQPLAGEVQGAFSRLEETLRAAMKREDSKEKRYALRELTRWQKNYTNNFGGVETQTAESTAIAVYGQEGLENVPIVRDIGYLANINYVDAQRQQQLLPMRVQESLEVFVRIMQMYARSPTEEGLTGIKKAVIEGKILASLLGVNFLDVYGHDISNVVNRFIETCLTKTHGHDNSAHAIAESGLGIKDKERLFITRVDLAARLIGGFGGSLYDNFQRELITAVVAYANRTNHDIGTLVQQLQSEQDPKVRQKLEDEMAALRASAVRVGEHYKMPIPPPLINVQHFQLPGPPKDLTDRMKS